MRLALSIAIAGTMLMSGGALAQTAAEKAECKADYEKYCSTVVPGDNRIIECLAKEMEKLTPECQAAVKAHMPQ